MYPVESELGFMPPSRPPFSTLLFSSCTEGGAQHLVNAGRQAVMLVGSPAYFSIPKAGSLGGAC